VQAASKEATPEPAAAKAPAAEAAPEAPAAPAEVCNGTDSAPAPAPAAAPSTEEAAPAPAPSASLESAIERGEKLQEHARNASPPTMDDVTEDHRPKEAFPEYQQQHNAAEETKKEESAEEKVAVAAEPEPEATGASAANDEEEEPCEEEEEEEGTNGAAGSDEASDSQKQIVLKYNYKEDQWSPLNPDGKKNYDRNFLLQLQYDAESTKKPTGLSHLPDIILDAVSVIS
jgi:translation initiation factor 4G